MLETERIKLQRTDAGGRESEQILKHPQPKLSPVQNAAASLHQEPDYTATGPYSHWTIQPPDYKAIGQYRHGTIQPLDHTATNRRGRYGPQSFHVLVCEEPVNIIITERT